MAQRRRQVRKTEAEIKRISEQMAAIVSKAMFREPALTPREREVILGLAAGQFNKEIADELHITERTVKYHVAKLLRRFGKKNRRELGDLVEFGILKTKKGEE